MRFKRAHRDTESSDEFERPPSGGYIWLPRRLGLGVLVTFAVAVFVVGVWVSQAEATHKKVRDMEKRLVTIERVVCLTCGVKCAELCKVR